MWFPAELSLSSDCKKDIQESSSLKIRAFSLRNYNPTPLAASLLSAVVQTISSPATGSRRVDFFPGLGIREVQASLYCPVLTALLADPPTIDFMVEVSILSQTSDVQ